MLWVIPLEKKNYLCQKRDVLGVLTVCMVVLCLFAVFFPLVAPHLAILPFLTMPAPLPISELIFAVFLHT